MSSPPAALMKVTALSALAAEAQVAAQVRSPRSVAPAKRLKTRPSIRLALPFIDFEAPPHRLGLASDRLWPQALLSAVLRIASKGSGAFPLRQRDAPA